jgi:hypothetical protein
MVIRLGSRHGPRRCSLTGPRARDTLAIHRRGVSRNCGVAEGKKGWEIDGDGDGDIKSGCCESGGKETGVFEWQLEECRVYSQM